MNYYDARRNQTTGSWDYTRMNDGRIWPVGYCASTIPCPCRPVVGAMKPDPECRRCKGSGWIDNPEHCGGHDTPEEARQCFARYLLDGWHEEEYGNWRGCEYPAGHDGRKCDKPTKQGLTTRPPLGQAFPLCSEHRTFSHLALLAPTDAGQITASY